MNLSYGRNGCPIIAVDAHNYKQWLADQPLRLRNWLEQTGFEGKGFCIVPKPNGELDQIVVVAQDVNSVWFLSEVAYLLPESSFYFEGDAKQLVNAALGWVLGQYQFAGYRRPKKRATLFINDQCVVKEVHSLAKGLILTRDLINTPAADMMPEQLSSTMKVIAANYGASFKEIVGETLLKENFPSIHTVGRASVHPPRLLEFNWGDASHPQLCLIGKGVCFDSGGLDLKDASTIRHMKKDMGGAAHVLGLALMIIESALPVQLRVLVPAVENAVSACAYRPGDIIITRKGLSVEISDTDAEGRLIMCDALTYADEAQPDLVIDFATLTGATRVGLGMEIPGFYCNDEILANQLIEMGRQEEDCVWRLPLYKPYEVYLKGTISDLVNCAETPLGGSITAALYLQKFVGAHPWVHFDIGAWNDRLQPGRPIGGEAMGLRAVLRTLKRRYCAEC